jgi:hypothetical protein
MATWLDIIGSVLIGTLIIFLIMKLNYQVSTNSSEISSNGMVQSYLTTIGTVMENDFYKIGYRVSGANKLNNASLKQFSFNGDVDTNGTVDSVRYYLGDSTQAKKTKNPNDKPLYRVLNGAAPIKVGTVRDCNFTYYDSTGSQMSYTYLSNSDTLKKIRIVKVYIKCESPYLINNYYQSAEYSRKIKPVNLK